MEDYSNLSDFNIFKTFTMIFLLIITNRKDILRPEVFIFEVIIK